MSTDDPAAGAATEEGALLPPSEGARSLARQVAAAARAERRPARRLLVPAEVDPVARVLVDLPLAHLDRPFDYLVPAPCAEAARPGSRVKVRFAGQDVDGFVLERAPTSDHPGRLAPLRRVVSPEPVLSPEIAELCQQVAERYAGTRSDVLRLAVPPRHATVEKEPPPGPRPPSLDLAAAETWWSRYAGSEPSLAAGLASGAAPRSVWTALPGEDWSTGLAHAAAAALSSGRGSVLCVPDRRDLARLDVALRTVLGPGQHVLLMADAGPAARYRAFLAASRGAVQVVAGTRAAAFAPVRALGLVAIWDDGDDLFAEPRAPYPHSREVLLLRAQATGAAALIGATSRSVEAQGLVSHRWAQELTAPRARVREAAPLVSITGATDRELEHDPLTRSARLPSSAAAAIRTGLGTGPVLVQTPRSGYATSLVCESCREPARCRTCSGPMQLSSPLSPPSCRWCGTLEGVRQCPHCGARGLRAPVLGDSRTAEELGRAFPGVTVRRSSGERVLDRVGRRAEIVVATPGAEPVADDGYAAVVLLDTWLALARADLRTGEEAVRRWLNAATLARPAARGGRVVAVGEPSAPTLQALVRWDPAGYAEREAADRADAHLPPASRLAVLTGHPEAVTAAAASLQLPPAAEVLGPVPVRRRGDPDRGRADDAEHARLVVRVPRRFGPALSEALRRVQRHRAARKLEPVRIQVDPHELS